MTLNRTAGTCLQLPQVFELEGLHRRPGAAACTRRPKALRAMTGPAQLQLRVAAALAVSALLALLASAVAEAAPSPLIAAPAARRPMAQERWAVMRMRGGSAFSALTDMGDGAEERSKVSFPWHAPPACSPARQSPGAVGCRTDTRACAVGGFRLERRHKASQAGWGRGQETVC